MKGKVSIVNKYLRLIIMISLVLGIILVAQSNVAWANQATGPSLSARSHPEQSILPAKDDCQQGNNKNKDKCKGTVKPPPKDIIIPVTGEYSVGGFCTLSVNLSDPKINLDASVVTPLQHELPDQVHKVRQGCLLTYYNASERIDALAPASGTTTICFAATPQKQMTIYFYNLFATDPVWAPLETTVENGVACAEANKSGIYVATFPAP